MTTDSAEYLAKKRLLAKTLTIYGRKPVLEALEDKHLNAQKLHLAHSNQNAPIINTILKLAQIKNIPIAYHSRDALSRISKNKQQDQGIALDIECLGFESIENLISQLPQHLHLIALDNVTNPQNVGMIIRSVCASPATGLLLPNKGCASLDSLVIKASAGTLFKAKIFRCETLAPALQQLRTLGCSIFGLDANATHELPNFKAPKRSIYVLGNETNGLSPQAKDLLTHSLKIPMCNGVESLNVSVAASLIAFRSCFAPH